MSTVVESALPRRVDLATWDECLSGRDDAYELVEGVPTMAPWESNINRAAGVAVASTLYTARTADWWVGTDVEVTLSEVPATVRRPDVVVAVSSALVRDRAPLPTNRVLAAEVLLVVEIVSPSSVERDLVTKRREYAAAGIPAYLVVDLRGMPGELTLYAARGADGAYLDVEPTGRVTADVAGTPVPIAVADLLP